MFDKVCKHCNNKFQTSYSKREFCSRACVSNWRKGRTWEELFGYKKAKRMKSVRSKETHFHKYNKKRIGKSLEQIYGKKKAINIKDKISKTTKGKTFEERLGLERGKKYRKRNGKQMSKISKSNMGKTWEEIYGVEKSKEIKKKITKPMTERKIRIKVKNSYKELHDKEIIKYTQKLEKEGFRCIPITIVFPDIIAFKDNKVYAYEIERTGRPRREKYTKNIRKYFDTVRWVLLKYKNKIIET